MVVFVQGLIFAILAALLLLALAAMFARRAADIAAAINPAARVRLRQPVAPRCQCAS